jgi:phage tail sheath protein FI
MWWDGTRRIVSSMELVAGSPSDVTVTSHAAGWTVQPAPRARTYFRPAHPWVSLEPNAEPLWAQIRLSVAAFLQTLFLQGAFQGRVPQQAYFVRCDGDTTTEADQAKGIVNILVGFTPLKPAEFVVMQIQQSGAMRRSRVHRG